MMKKLKINLTPKNMRKKRLAITMMISFALLSTISLADYSCMNSTTSQFSTTITVSGSNIPISYNDTCKFGCQTETGKCNPSPYDIGIMDIGVMYGLFAIGVLFFILSWKTENDAYRVYFFFAGLLFLLANMLAMITYINVMNKATSLGYVEDMLWWVLVIYAFSIVILFVLMFVDFWKLLGEKKVFEKLGFK